MPQGGQQQQQQRQQAAVPLRVLSIQSSVVHGYVGNKCAVFPLQLLGFDVDPIHSVQFSNHTGYPRVKGQKLDGDQLWDLVETMHANGLSRWDIILTGYIGTESFARTILRVVRLARQVNPAVRYVCDPVMGDYDLDGNAFTYVPPSLLPVFQQELVAQASLLTPNQLEVERLTDTKITSIDDAKTACDVLHAKGVSTVVITSMRLAGDPRILIVASQRPRADAAAKRFILSVPHRRLRFTGTGDLTTALLAAWTSLHPDAADLGLACRNTFASVQAVIERTAKLQEQRAAAEDAAGRAAGIELQLIASRREIETPPIEAISVELLDD